MKLVAVFSTLAFIVFLSGCSSLPTQPAIDLSFKNIPKDQKIGLYVSKLPKITTAFPGAGCLLCLGAASLANSALTKQVETWQAGELSKTKDLLSSQLKELGYSVVIIDTLLPEKKLPKVKPTPSSTLSKNYASYKDTFSVDQLLVVSFDSVGVLRQYSSYVPTGAPYVNISAKYYMIDLTKNEYSFYAPISIIRNADGAWDQSPNFPNMTNAFYQAEEQAVDLIKKPLN